MHVVIIGAGIAGLLAAREIINTGVVSNVTIFEEDSSIGKPEHCTGIVSENFLRLVPEARDFILGKYKYMEIIGKDFKTIAELKFRNYIYMIDRAAVEQKVAEKILDKALILTRTKVTDILVHKDSVKIILSEQSKYSQSLSKQDIVIVCEGARQYFARKLLGFSSRKYVYGIQCDCKSYIRKEMHEDTIYILYDRKFSDLYFSWIVPQDNDIVRVGLGAHKLLKQRFEMLTRLVKPIKVLKVFGGKILLDKCPDKIYVKNVLFMGDSVNFIKPMTGGGNSICAFTARILGKCISNFGKYYLDGVSLARLCAISLVRFVRSLQHGADTLYDLIMRSTLRDVALDLLSCFRFVIPVFDIQDFDIQARYVEKISVRII